MKDAEAVRLTLFGTSGCHLCEEAAEMLAIASPIQWRTVDIADDEALFQRYGTRIPVIRDDLSGVELNWPFGTAELASLCACAARLNHQSYVPPPGEHST